MIKKKKRKESNFNSIWMCYNFGQDRKECPGITIFVLATPDNAKISTRQKGEDIIPSGKLL